MRDDAAARFPFRHELVDVGAGFDGWGAVAVADFDGDGRPEFATGGKGGGFYYLYDWTPAGWQRHTITHAFSPQVGAAAADLDGDGRPEIVCGEWGPRLLWLQPPARGLDDWTPHVVWEGLGDPHDILAADLDGDGRAEIIVREKDGPLRLFRPPADPAQAPWPAEVIAEHLEGDGTAVAKLERRAPPAIVTNAGIYRRTPDGWAREPLLEPSLSWHPETRLAVADVDGDGALEVVITESEIARARLAILKPGRPSQPWDAQVVLGAYLDLRALHSLQIADLDGDGAPEIFVAEMENGKSDGVHSRPRWWCLARTPAGLWQPHVLLDANLGTHSAVVADYNGDGRPDIVGKVWRPNRVNSVDGRHHVDALMGVSPR